MKVQALCRFCGQTALFDPDVMVDGYPHRFNGAGEAEPMACDNVAVINVVDTSRVPESQFVPTPIKSATITCRENVKDAFPHHPR